jgi:hypothetical protein
VRVVLRPGTAGAAGVGLAVGLGWSARSDGLATGAGLFAACLLAALVRPRAHVGAPPSAHVGATPSSAHVGATPSSAHVGATPSSAHVGATPSSAHVGATPSSAHVGATPSSAHVGGPPVRRALGVGLGLALGLAVGVAPYAIAMRLHAGEWRISLKKRLDDVVRVPPAESPAIDLAPAVASARPLTLDALVRLELHGGDLAEALDTSATRPPPGQALLFAGRKIVSAAHPLLLLLALLLICVGPRRGEAAWARTVHAVWCLPLLAWWAVHTLLKANVGYTSDVHTSAVGVLVALPAGLGLLRLAGRVPWRNAWRVLLGAALAALLPKALAPQRASYAIEREVGRALRAAAGPGPLALSGHDGRVVAHYAGAAWVDLPVDAPPARALEALRAQGVRALVFVLRRRATSSSSALHDGLVAAGAAPLHEGTFSASRGEVRYDWALYRIPERTP